MQEIIYWKIIRQSLLSVWNIRSGVQLPPSQAEIKNALRKRKNSFSIQRSSRRKYPAVLLHILEVEQLRIS